VSKSDLPASAVFSNVKALYFGKFLSAVTIQNHMGNVKNKYYAIFSKLKRLGNTASVSQL
jgi:hypothetical protein